MPLIQLEESRRREKSIASTQVEPKTPESAGELEVEKESPTEDLTQPRLTAEQRWVIEARGEIDDYMLVLRRLRSMPPDQVFMELSGITARLAELRLSCVRSEARRLTALRTREIDPLIEECDRQFRFHSRIQAVRNMEADMTRNLT